MEMILSITSLHHPVVKRIKRLQQKTRFRQKEKAFFVEGVPITLTAIENQAPIETIVFSDVLLTDNKGLMALAQQRAQGISCIAVSERLFRKIAQRNNPDGLGAICQTTWQDLDDLVIEPSSIFVATVCISDPGNLGSILRTADSTRAAGLILVGQSTIPFHPRTVKASRGTVFTVPICHCPDIETLFDWANTHHIDTIATSAKTDRSFWEATYRFPVLCIFGNEHKGLDTITMGRADRLATIPMEGTTSSLNLSVAVGVILYELKRIYGTGRL